MFRSPVARGLKTHNKNRHLLRRNSSFSHNTSRSPLDMFGPHFHSDSLVYGSIVDPSRIHFITKNTSVFYRIWIWIYMSWGIVCVCISLVFRTWENCFPYFIERDAAPEVVELPYINMEFITGVFFLFFIVCEYKTLLREVSRTFRKWRLNLTIFQSEV